MRDSRARPCFDIRLSVEKDEVAYRTLHLRSFVRSFGLRAPDEYYEYLRGERTRESLLGLARFRDNHDRADSEAWHKTLSEDTHREVSRRIRQALGGASDWILIGGPPCQAYSVVGRSRMRSVNPRKFARDERHFLYREYLHIISEHAPPVFVMENVKGLLSARIAGGSTFERILEDLAKPNGGSLRYRLVPFTAPTDLFDTKPGDYIIKSEQFGVPQNRHRVILCGIRDDLSGLPEPLKPQRPLSIEAAIAGLPRLRSRLSREPDSKELWLDALLEGAQQVKREGGKNLRDVAEAMLAAAERARRITMTGGRYLPLSRTPLSPESLAGNGLRSWYTDQRLEGVVSHEARAHMRSDLHRYLFAASYAEIRGDFPRLHDFPQFLAPRHRNARGNRAESPFTDRFRVQCYGRPATTVVSHIAKDGHYFIHPDPKQCRSLTVREAARIQTFPDNYFFEGNRTQQFVQVGNAVPPWLARQIAETVFSFISAIRLPEPRAARGRESRLASLQV